MELFPENSVMFTINNLEHFIKPFLENPVDEYKRIGLFFVFCFWFVYHSVQWCYFFSFVFTTVFRTSLTVIYLSIYIYIYYISIICYVPVLHALQFFWSWTIAPIAQLERRWSSNCNTHFSLPPPSCVRGGPPQRAGGCFLLLWKPLWVHFCDVGICPVSFRSFVLLHVVISVLRRLEIASFCKLLTYPFLKPTFCPKWEVSVNVGLGEG